MMGRTLSELRGVFAGEPRKHVMIESDAKAPRRNDEELLQRAIVQHLRLRAAPNVIWYAIPNGEHRSKRTGGRLKAMGVLAGAPDLAFVLADGRAAYMELKAPGGRLSREQHDFLDRCAAMMVEHVVCSSIDTALRVLEAWGVLPGSDPARSAWRGQASD